jgi:hypothetical protein
MTIRDEIAEIDENALCADGFDDAIIGWTDSWGPHENGGVSRPVRVVYSIRRCVELLVEQGMSQEDAAEYLEFNTVGAYVGPQTPIFVRDLEES